VSRVQTGESQLMLPVATLLQWWKNLVRWCQILEVLQLQPQKRAKRSNLYVSVGIVGLSHVRVRQCTTTPSLQDVEFLDHKTSDFMFPCCSVLTR